ncbi:hypothetical protein L7F22_004520 [Adiantum nelumboides]|nr:hypothetical protein [Adiantum nelumboides]
MTSNFWKGLFENLGTRLNFSSAYHPQTDGQSEIANLTILDLLKSYVTEVDQRSQWEKYLPLVEYAYNNTIHTSTGKAPFEVIEGRSKSPLLLKVHGKIFATDEYSRDLKESFQKIKEAISISQQKQKAAANKHRRALAFKENEWVLLKFPKARLRHTSGKNPTRHQKYYAKLAKRYYGPFQILKPINEMAYQLKLPSQLLIHNAFHVSLLKPYKGKPPSEAIMEYPPEVEDQEEVLQPECILRHEDKVLRHDTKELSDIGIQCISHYDWHEDPLGTPIFPIPKNEIFHINGVAFEVRLSCIQGAGYGLFVHSAIESGVTILHYGGPKYGFQEWKKICKLIPRAIKYSLVEDPKVEEEEDRAYILGFVEEGNVSGYINSSHCMDFHPNVRYALDPNLPPWYKGISSHIKSKEYGHICIETICRVEPGEELFANYEFT